MYCGGKKKEKKSEVLRSLQSFASPYSGAGALGTVSDAMESVCWPRGDSGGWMHSARMREPFQVVNTPQKQPSEGLQGKEGGERGSFDKS